MNEIINKFLLVGDKFMPEMHSKQPGFTYRFMYLQSAVHLHKIKKELNNL